MIGARRLIATSGAVFGSQMLMAVTAIITARPLGPDGRGIVAAVITWMMMITWAANLSLPSAMTVRVSRDRNALGAALANAVLYSTVAVGFAAIFAAALIPRLIGQLGDNAGLYAALMMLTIPLAALGEFLFAGLLIVDKIARFNTLKVLQATIPLGVAVIAVPLDRMTPAVFLAAILVSGLVVYVLAGLALPWSRFAVSLQDLRKDLRFGARVHLGGLLGVATARLDILIMSIFISASQIGFYSTANNLMAPITIVAAGMSILILPAVARREQTEGNSSPGQVRALARRSLLLGIPGGILLLATAPFLIPILFGSAFKGAIWPTLILIPGYIARSYAIVAASGAVGMRRPWAPTATEGVGLTLTLILLPVLLFTLGGALAAATTSTAAYIASAITAFFILRRIERGAPPGRNPTRHAVDPSKEMLVARSVSEPYPI